MSSTADLSAAAIYVGTYAKYNSGSLFGKWLNLSDFSDLESFYEACAELHDDEKDPEYMFQDYENIPEGMVSECSLSENFFTMRDALADLDAEQIEAFYIWCNNGHHDLNKEDADDLINAFQEEYVGHYDSEEDFAREYLEDTQNLSEFVLRYFDYESYARDLFMESYWSDDGHVFHNV